MDLAELQERRRALLEARLSGHREIRDATGEAVSYKSEREMASALAFLDAEIARLSGATSKSRLIAPNFTKGL